MTISSKLGRWTTDEHRLFVRGLLLFGKDWGLIAKFIKTRTVVQVRTHAQKYFIKMKKYKTIQEERRSSDGEASEMSAPNPSEQTVCVSDIVAETLGTTPDRLAASYLSAQHVLYDFLSAPLPVNVSTMNVPHWFQYGLPLSLLLRNVSDTDFLSMASKDVQQNSPASLAINGKSRSIPSPTELEDDIVDIFDFQSSPGLVARHGEPLLLQMDDDDEIILDMDIDVDEEVDKLFLNAENFTGEESLLSQTDDHFVQTMDMMHA